MKEQNPKCDGVHGCNAPVTHVDHKGWGYCTEHGRCFSESRPVRKLRPWEVRRLQAGKTILYERVTQAEFLRRYPEPHPWSAA